jgi:hypothetical protein
VACYNGPQIVSNKPSPAVYFLEDTVGSYLFSVTNGKVHVIGFFSKTLIGTQLNVSAREKECYGIYSSS